MHPMGRFPKKICPMGWDGTEHFVWDPMGRKSGPMGHSLLFSSKHYFQHRWSHSTLAEVAPNEHLTLHYI